MFNALKNKFESLTNIWVVVLLLIAISPSFIPLMRSGYFYMQDDLQAFRIHQMNECFEDGQIPCRWVPDAGYQYGYPQFNFYPPSVYYIGEVIHLVGFSITNTVKIMFILGYILSALAMYVLVKDISGKWSGFIAGVLYTYIPYKAVEVYVRGALNEFWALIAFPLIFWAIYKLIKTAKARYIVWLSVSIAFLLTTHLLMTMIFIVPALVWTFYWLYAEKKRNLLPHIILSSVLGFLLASFFVLPAFFEKQHVHAETLLMGYFGYRQHFVNLYDLLFSREWGYGSSGFPDELLNLSTGLVQWVFAVIVGFIALVKFKEKQKISKLIFVLLGLTGLILFLIHVRSSFIWDIFTFLEWLQFPWRFLSVSIFLLSIIGAIGVSLLNKRNRYLVGVIVIFAAVILNIGFYRAREWYEIKDREKFLGELWEKQLTISIFDYLPKSAEFPPVAKAPEVPEILEGVAVFDEYTKGSNYQTGTITVNTPRALIRAPLYDFPGMRVEIDGLPVGFVSNDCRGQEFCLGLVTFWVPEGEHEIDIRLTNTPIRVIGNLLSVLGLLGVAYIAYKKPKFIGK